MRVELDEDKAKLQWDGFADVESGIQSFRIYRKGNLIGEIKGEHQRVQAGAGDAAAGHAGHRAHAPVEERQTLPSMRWYQ